MLHTMFHGNRSTGSGEEVSKGLYHTWTWWPFRLYDPDAANKLSFPLPIETLHNLCLRIFQLGRHKRGGTATEDC